MALVVNPLHPLFAAEMLDADLRQEPSPDLVDAVNAAMARYAVLVIRDQQITDEQQIRFSRKFGPLELPPHMGMKGDPKRRIRPELYDVSNLDVNGEFLPQESLRHASNKANEEFHSDSSFNSLPTKWSLLMGHVVPPERGDTLFADARAAYDALPEPTKVKARSAVAEHYFWKTRGRAGYNEITADMKKAMPPVQHDVVRVIPQSGRAALYIGEHTTHIVGWPREEGEQFLAELNTFATQPQFIYTHKWRAGDLVVWDNRCTLHRAAGYDVYKYKRDLRRTTINERGPEVSSTEAIGVAAPG
ncbi:MAG TPA: TauD/TfdA family dioxygenase [Steroidobacteraceae bacterium]|nr:TauD/TfdA family dioxygenase [Steroidobacteraceae bacterium]